MARIPDETLERLKREVPLARLVERRGVKLVRHGADLIGLCPFHDDREPSLVVSPEKNLWNCLGACRAGGTVVDWVMRAEGVSFRHAVELLRADVPVGDGAEVVRTSTVRKLPPPVDRSSGDSEALEQVVGFYHETLKQSPEALAYLEKRGLWHPEMVAHFRLGYANRTLGLRLPAKNRKAGEEVRGRLEKLGIIRETGHEHFNGSVVVPVFDSAGTVAGMYGRKITENLRPGTPLHLYLPGPHRGVWNEAALEAAKEIILCESLIDALTFWCAGFRNVTASYGVNGFTDDHREAFRRHGIERVRIAYDRDEAGESAAAELAVELGGMGIECFRVLFPKGMDANEYALKVTPAEKSLGVLLNRAEWIGKGRRPEQPAAKEEMLVAETVSSLVAEVAAGEVSVVLGDRKYRVRGLDGNAGFESLKVNMVAECGENMHVDTVDLYSARQRAGFAKSAAAELRVREDVVRQDLGRVLRRAEEVRAEREKEVKPVAPAASMTEGERAAALELLRSPDLLERILADFDRCGVVGEEANKLTGYIAAVSRHLESPLAVVVQSSSAAGKSSLMEAVLAFVPEEEKVQYSAMTGQSLFYMGEADLKHKVLAIAEEEGASRAAYALKLLQSEGVLTLASTGKDPATGRLVTHRYRVEGPVMIFLTTTAIDLDEELMNRCLVLTVDEDREQTRAIHRRQREAQTIEGLLAREERAEILKVHRNAQRLLRPLFVANPWARDLTFPDGRTRSRRDHTKYLALIRSVALLHQHQRAVRTAAHKGKTIEYIEASLEDIGTANRLAHGVLGRSLDELPPQTRRLLGLVDGMVSEECGRLGMERADYRFSRRDVRARTGWGDTQLKVHLRRLEELEYLLAHRGGRGQSFVYELVYEVVPGEAGVAVFPGLIDVEKLRYDGNRAGYPVGLAGAGRGDGGVVSGGGRNGFPPMMTGVGGHYGAAEA